MATADLLHLLPKYHQIKESLRVDLARLPPESRLPSVRVLRSRFQTSQTTLDRALRELEGEGLLRREHGRGMFKTGTPTLRAGPGHRRTLKLETSGTCEAFEERRYEWLYGEELFRLMQERPLAWLPLGILEQHGAHLPWGLDGLKAHAVCLRLAARIGGVVLPASHLSGIHGDCREADASEFRRRFAAIGDLLYREQTFQTWLDETFDGLANLGFRAIVAYTGHYPEVQTRLVREAAEAFTATGGATVIPFWEPLACGDGDHGGRWETSIALALDAGTVRLEAIRDERTGQAGYYRGQDVRSHASTALGEQALAQVEAYLAGAIERAFRESENARKALEEGR